MKALSRKAVLATGAVMNYLAPKLAQDAKIDLFPAFQGVSAKNFKDKKPGIVAAITDITKGKLAQDAEIADLPALLDAFQAVEVAEGADADPDSGLPMSAEEMSNSAMDADPVEKVKALLAGKVDDATMAAICTALGAGAADADESEEDKAKKAAAEKAEPGITKAAMDAALEASAKTMRETARAVREAEKAVRPYVGELAIAQDSAEDVYHAAFKIMGVDTTGVKELPALKAILNAQRKPGDRNNHSAPVMDEAAAKSFEDRHPNAAAVGIA